MQNNVIISLFVSLSVFWREREIEKFRVAVNVPPGARVSFSLSYEELLSRRLGRYELTLGLRPGQPVQNLSLDVSIAERTGIRFVRALPLRTSRLLTNNVQGTLKETSKDLTKLIALICNVGYVCFLSVNASIVDMLIHWSSSRCRTSPFNSGPAESPLCTCALQSQHAATEKRFHQRSPRRLYHSIWRGTQRPHGWHPGLHTYSPHWS